MSAGRCQFREPPDVVRTDETSLAVYYRLLGTPTSVRVGRHGVYLCGTCGAHTAAERGGIGCGATRAVEAVAARERGESRGERGSIAA